MSIFKAAVVHRYLICRFFCGSRKYRDAHREASKWRNGSGACMEESKTELMRAEPWSGIGENDLEMTDVSELNGAEQV